MRSKSIHTLSRLLCTALAAVFSSAAFAQAALEEITVTAQKRTESLLEVPVAVSVVSGDNLERAQIRDVIDLQQLAPSLVVNASTGSTNTIFSIRGIGTAGNNTGLEQSVGVFIDGVYRGRVGSAMSDYVDIQQVEILRGPQSTLFGKNTSAGVISVTTRKPEYEMSGVIDASVGDFGMAQLKGSITGPLIADKLAFRLSGSAFQRDGVIDDILQSGLDVNNRDRVTGRLQLLWDVGDATTIRFIGDYSDVDDSCCIATPVFAGPTAGLTGLLGGPGSMPGGTSGQVNAFDRLGASTPGLAFDNGFIDGGASAQLDHGFSAMDLTIIAASRFFETWPRIDSDFQRMDLLSDRVQAQDLEESSFEIRLASSGGTAFDWIIGAYVFDQDIDATDDLILGAQGRAYGNALTQAATGGALDFPTLEFLFGLPAGSIFADGTGTRNTFDYSASGVAVFTQGTWHIDDQLSITAGLRYSDEEKDNTSINTLATEPFSQVPLPPPFAGLAAFQVFPATDPYSNSFSDDNVSGTFNVSYTFNDDTSGYLRYATGFKSGGLNLSRNAGASVPGNPTPNPANGIFQSETVDSVELGLKTRLADGRGILNVAIFSQTLEDFQANSFDGLAFTVRNAAEVEGLGLEVDYVWSLTDNLQLSGGVVLQDIEYASFPGASATQAQVDAGMNVQDLSGKKPNFVSDFLATGTISWTKPINSNMNFIASADYRYRSKYSTGQDLDPQALQDDLFWVNAALGVEQADGKWAVQAWVKNATDEEVFNIVFDSPFQAGSFHAFIEDPRTAGVNAIFRF
ncbi:MAG: TonB-dependent receptor [Gammaproteobacteria bacterium]|nr:TonB-dependent receptor [Gammaproteobacteria bacterium]NNC55921.1 TonB-dependent receptor [Woeseiaceae bacterium]